MQKQKGKIIYVPSVIIDEVEDIRREDGIDSRPEAFRSLVKYARVGRETKRIIKLDFSKAIPRVPVENYSNIPSPVPWDSPIDLSMGMNKKYKKSKKQGKGYFFEGVL